MADTFKGLTYFLTGFLGAFLLSMAPVLVFVNVHSKLSGKDGLILITLISGWYGFLFLTYTIARYWKHENRIRNRR